MDMYLNLSENVRNGVESREVAREMLKAHLKKVRGMTVQDKEMEKTQARQAAKKKLKSDGILRAVMGSASSGDWEADLVARKPKKSKARKVWSSAEESSDEEPIKPRKKKAKQDREPKDWKKIGQIKMVPGKTLYGLDGFVPPVRAGGRSKKLSKEAPTTFPGTCLLCDTKGHKVFECDRKSADDGDTVYPLSYLYKKGLVDEWGVITEKGKKKKGL